MNERNINTTQLSHTKANESSIIPKAYSPHTQLCLSLYSWTPYGITVLANTSLSPCDLSAFPFNNSKKTFHPFLQSIISIYLQ